MPHAHLRAGPAAALVRAVEILVRGLQERGRGPHPAGTRAPVPLAVAGPRLSDPPVATDHDPPAFLAKRDCPNNNETATSRANPEVRVCVCAE